MTITTISTNKSNGDGLSQNDLLIQIILSNMPGLTRGNVYLTEHLIGSDVWKTLSKGMRIGLGSLVY